MPIIRVSWVEESTLEQRAKLAKGIAEAVESIGLQKQYVHVIFEEVPKDRWALGGIMVSEMKL